MAIVKLKNKTGVAYRAMIRDSNHRQVTKVFKRKIDAEQFEAEMKLKVQRGYCFSGIRVDFAELSKYWIDNYAKVHKEFSSVFRDEQFLRIWINPVIGSKDIRKIKSVDIIQIAMNMREKGLSNSTINKMITLVRKIYNDAMDSEWFGVLDINPVAKIKPYKHAQGEMRFWTKKEIERFLHTLKSHFRDHYPFFMFLANTGCRLGEALALTISDIDFQNNHIQISKSFCIRSRAVKHTKSGKIQYVGLSKELGNVLKDQIERVRNFPKRLMFPNSAGNELDAGNIKERVMKKAAKMANLKPIRLHDLRHSYAANFLMSGGDMFSLKNILGHASITTTERYSHFTRDYLTKQAEIFTVSGNTADYGKLQLVG